MREQESQPTKRCCRCERDLSEDEFNVCTANKDGLYSCCRICRREDRKRRYTKAERHDQYLRYSKTIPAKCCYLLKKAKQRAQERNIPCTLTKEWATERLERGRCEVTGIQFVFDTPRHPFTPSIDRIDPQSEKGYSPDNARIVIWMVNAAKNNSSDELFFACLKQVAEAILRAS